MVTRRLIALALLAGVVGCELAEVTVAETQPRVVVHATLNPDAEEQVILVENSLTGRVDINDGLRFNPLDPIRTAGGDPIVGATVQLFAGADTTGVTAIESRVQNRGTGRYTVSRAQLAILPGRAYRLRIRTTDNREVTGETLVPSAPAGWVRGAGLIPRALTFNRATDTVQLSWAPSADARTYGIRVETPNGPWFLFSDSTRFSLSGSLRNFFVPGLPSVWYPGFRQSLAVVAEDRNFFDYNRSGNDFFGGTGLISSVRGGIGLFGSLLVLETRTVTVIDRDRAPLDARWVGVTALGDTVEYELWVETAGANASSVSGRARGSPGVYAIGILQGETLRLAALSTSSARDTAAFFTGRVAGDVITGTYNSRFSTTGPTVFRRAARRPL